MVEVLTAVLWLVFVGGLSALIVFICWCLNRINDLADHGLLYPPQPTLDIHDVETLKELWESADAKLGLVIEKVQYLTEWIEDIHKLELEDDLDPDDDWDTDLDDDDDFCPEEDEDCEECFKSGRCLGGDECPVWDGPTVGGGIGLVGSTVSAPPSTEEPFKGVLSDPDVQKEIEKYSLWANTYPVYQSHPATPVIEVQEGPLALETKPVYGDDGRQTQTHVEMDLVGEWEAVPTNKGYEVRKKVWSEMRDEGEGHH